jgi:hypothetical protein
MLTLAADDVVSFQPERLRESSQRFVNFWVGALSPAWAPFFAASSFGLGAWALTQALGKSEGLFGDLPLATKWPGFAPWLNAALPEEEPQQVAAEVVEQAAGFVAPVETAMEAAAQETAETFEQAVETAAQETAETVDVAMQETQEIAEQAADTAVQGFAAVADQATSLADDLAPQLEQAADTVSEETKTFIDPVTETPVVPEAVEAVAEPAPAPAPVIEPRPIAKTLAAAKAKKPAK